MRPTPLTDDERTFVLRLYRDYSAFVRDQISSVLQQDGQVEDLVSEAFIRLMGKISLLRGLGAQKTTTYVARTARNVAIDYIRRRETHNKNVCCGLRSGGYDAINSSDDSIEDQVIGQQEILHLLGIVSKLPEKERFLLYGKYGLNLSDAEIAAELDIAPSSVRQYLSLARKKLGQRIRKEAE